MHRVIIKSIICTLLSAACISGAALAQSDATPSRVPLGLWFWSAEKSQDVLSVAIETVDGEWHATLGSASVAATHDHDVISFRQPDGSRFVGELAADKSEIRGYWYQPSTQLDYQDVATPIVISAVEEGKWQADIAIQPRPVQDIP